MNKGVFRQLSKNIEKIEKQFGSLENFVVTSTNLNEKHKMKIEEDYSSTFQELLPVYQDLSELERVDLLDYHKFVGRFDGKFG